MIKELAKHFKITLILLAVSVLALLLVIFFPQKKNFNEPVENGLRDSVYDKFIPGIASENDVIKVLGKPASIMEKGGKKYYTYLTKSVNFNNSVVFKNGTVYYSVENFFGDYKRKPADYLKTYGKPELNLYDLGNETVVWNVFLKKGVAISVFPFEKIILKILYFSPQLEKSFMQNISPELGFVKEEVKEKPEEITAPGY